YPSRRGEPKTIVNYMSGDQSFLAPIMSNPENVYQLGPNAYGKPATALNILRETVMGKDLFDHAFKTYAQRWMFKHPTPADFFRTMEDASAVDLDWFWRGWFYTTDFVDIGVKEVKQFFVSDEPSREVLEMLKNYGMTQADLPPVVYTMVEDNEDFKLEYKSGSPIDHSIDLKFYMDQNTTEPGPSIKIPKNFYEITFEKPGGLVMPLIADFIYSDGSIERIKYPVQVWRKNENEMKKVLVTDKEIISIIVDPDQETADIDLSNNRWPKINEKSEFDQFKAKMKN
ncbi:MAG: M1 family peptidase, partial [Bacteroidota bacterium]|nr:M1 family peptidase [Bacteroidota bacterium]